MQLLILLLILNLISYREFWKISVSVSISCHRCFIDPNTTKLNTSVKSTKSKTLPLCPNTLGVAPISTPPKFIVFAGNCEKFIIQVFLSIHIFLPLSLYLPLARTKVQFNCELRRSRSELHSAPRFHINFLVRFIFYNITSQVMDQILSNIIDY